MGVGNSHTPLGSTPCKHSPAPHTSRSRGTGHPRPLLEGPTAPPSQPATSQSPAEEEGELHGALRGLLRAVPQRALEHDPRPRLGLVDDRLLAKDADADELAPYEWTMTQEYLFKAKEEWGNASFGDAESLAKEANEWAARAEQAALRLQRYQDAEGMHETVPEEIESGVNEEDPLFAPPERIELIEDEP